MTNLKKASLLAAFVLTLAYLCGAFIAWDINPGHWTLILRVCMAGGGCSLAALIGAFKS